MGHLLTAVSQPDVFAVADDYPTFSWGFPTKYTTSMNTTSTRGRGTKGLRLIKPVTVTRRSSLLNLMKVVESEFDEPLRDFDLK